MPNAIFFNFRGSFCSHVYFLLELTAPNLILGLLPLWALTSKPLRCCWSTTWSGLYRNNKLVLLSYEAFKN